MGWGFYTIHPYPLLYDHWYYSTIILMDQLHVWQCQEWSQHSLQICPNDVISEPGTQCEQWLAESRYNIVDKRTKLDNSKECFTSTINALNTDFYHHNVSRLAPSQHRELFDEIEIIFLYIYWLQSLSIQSKASNFCSRNQLQCYKPHIFPFTIWNDYLSWLTMVSGTSSSRLF